MDITPIHVLSMLNGFAVLFSCHTVLCLFSFLIVLLSVAFVPFCLVHCSPNMDNLAAVLNAGDIICFDCCVGPVI